MVLLALVIVSFKVSDFGMMILKTLQNADSDIWPRTWETFWTTASKGKKVPGSTFCESRILSGGQHNYVHRTWLHTMWRVSFPKCQISCILDISTLKNQICANPCLVQVSSLQSKTTKALQSHVCNKNLVKAQIYYLHWYFRKNQNSMEQAMEAADKVWFPDPDWSLILILTEGRRFS